MASGRLALLVGLIAAAMTAALAQGARVTDEQMLFRAGLAFAVFAVLTKAIAGVVLFLVPDLLSPAAGHRSPARTGGSGRGRSGVDDEGGGDGAGLDRSNRRGGRLDVTVPGATADDVVGSEPGNSGSGKEVAG